MENSVAAPERACELEGQPKPERRKERPRRPGRSERNAQRKRARTDEKESQTAARSTWGKPKPKPVAKRRIEGGVTLGPTGPHGLVLTSTSLCLFSFTFHRYAFDFLHTTTRSGIESRNMCKDGSERERKGDSSKK